MEPSRKKSILQSLVAILTVAAIAGVGYGVYKSRFEPPTQDMIDDAFIAKDYEKVVTLVNRMDLSNDNGKNHFILASSYSFLGNDKDALTHFMKSDDLEYQRSQSRYSIAAIYSKKGDDFVARFWLKDARESESRDSAKTTPPRELKRITDSPEWKDFIRADTVRKGSAPFGPEVFNGVFNAMAVRRGKSGPVKYEHMFDGTAIKETFEGLNGHDALFVKADEGEFWDYTMTDRLGRISVGRARFTDELEIEGTTTYLDGTIVLFRIEGRGVPTKIDMTRYESTDDGKTWDMGDRYRLNKNAHQPNTTAF